MLVMGIDTSLQRCSVAIMRGETVIAECVEDMARGHAEHLAPMAAAVLDQAGISIAALDRVGVVIGPGGFTGVRVGLSFARGLAIGTDVQVVGVTSLAALAGNVAKAPSDALIASVIDARRGQVYGALYDTKGVELVSPFVTDPEAAIRKLADAVKGAPVLMVGNGAGLLPEPPEDWSLSGVDDQINPTIVARLSVKAAQPSNPPAPLYLRGPDAKPPKPGPFDGLNAS